MLNAGVGTTNIKGSSKEDPPCGISYLRAAGGKPFQLKASITWEGSGDTGGDLPNGTFDGTQDINVQEIQPINR